MGLCLVICTCMAAKNCVGNPWGNRAAIVANICCWMACICSGVSPSTAGCPSFFELPASDVFSSSSFTLLALGEIWSAMLQILLPTSFFDGELSPLRLLLIDANEISESKMVELAGWFSMIESFVYHLFGPILHSCCCSVCQSHRYQPNRRHRRHLVDSEETRSSCSPSSVDGVHSQTMSRPKFARIRSLFPNKFHWCESEFYCYTIDIDILVAICYALILR